jgi:hypothetical protein
MFLSEANSQYTIGEQSHPADFLTKKKLKSFFAQRCLLAAPWIFLNYKMSFFKGLLWAQICLHTYISAGLVSCSDVKCEIVWGIELASHGGARVATTVLISSSGTSVTPVLKASYNVIFSWADPTKPRAMSGFRKLDWCMYVWPAGPFALYSQYMRPGLIRM